MLTHSDQDPGEPREQRELEARLQLVIEATDLGTWDWNLVQDRIELDERAYRILGYANATAPIDYARLRDLTHPADWPTLEQRMVQSLASSRGFCVEFRLRSKNRGWIWTEACGKVISHDWLGRPLRMVGTFADMSAREVVTETLRHEREVFLTGPVMLIRWRNEPGWPVSYVSANVATILGHPLSAWTGGEIVYAELIHPEDRERVAREVAAAASGSLAFEHTPYRLRHADGHYLWMFDHTSIERDGAGTIHAYYGYVLDISSRLMAEEKLALWGVAFIFAHEGIFVTDATGAVLEVNQAFLDMTGYTRHEFVGQNPRILKSGYHDPSFYHQLWRDIAETGSWRGELHNKKNSGERYTQSTVISAVRDARGQVSHYIGMAHDITAARESEQRLLQLAYYDALTGLPNRTLLGDRLHQAIAQSKRSNSGLAVCYLDLDDFKAVNDRLGHKIGDRLLIQVALRLLDNIRSGDTVARIGGDEFVLLLNGLDSIEEYDVPLRRLLSGLATSFDIDDEVVQISGSIGITLYPQDSSDPDTLLRHADHAMYAAKQAGRNRYHFFDTQQDRRAQAYRSALERLWVALSAGEFRLHYQPKVDMRLGRPVGLEGLIRWQHPERGLLPPSEFLDVVDDGELSIPLGDWVIEAALTQMEVWQARGVAMPVSVNISGRQLQADKFITNLRAALQRHPGIEPGMLEVEILETAALSDLAKVAAVIEDCQRLGISFAIDDFGTGFSSLSYLRRLPANTLKIDQSFVRDILDDPDDTAIVDGVIGLGNAFRRRLVAEGVESVEHGLLLMRLGCDLAQGYAISRPMPPEQVIDWWQTWVAPAIWQENADIHFAGEDAPLFTLEIDQKRWFAQLLEYTRHPSDTAGSPQMDSGKCRFGHWLRDTGLRRHGHKPVFQRLFQAHERIHALAREVTSELQLYRLDHDQVEGRLCAARDAMLIELHGLQAEVALHRTEPAL